MSKVKVIALGNDKVNRWIMESLGRSDSIDVTCESDLVETVIRLKREKFAVALVDSLVPDLAVTCYRINSLYKTPLALLTGGTKVEGSELRSLDADGYIPVESNATQLLYEIGEINRQGRQQSNKIKSPVDILLIEDDPLIENDVRSAFRFYWPQARVYLPSAAQPGIELSAKKMPDAILLDIGIRKVSAFTVLRRIRSFCQSPIIILTDNKEETPIIKATRYGADDYLMKPVRKVELIVKVRQYIKQAAA